MLKRILLIALSILMAVSAAACGSAKAVSVPNAERLYAKMEELNLFPEMVRRGDELIYDFYGIDPSRCVQLLNYVTEDGLVADEVLFAEMQDESYAKETEEILRDILLHLAESYRDYMPEEYEKVKNGRIVRNGTSVLMIISDHEEELLKVYTDMIK